MADQRPRGRARRCKAKGESGDSVEESTSNVRPEGLRGTAFSGPSDDTVARSAGRGTSRMTTAAVEAVRAQLQGVKLGVGDDNVARSARRPVTRGRRIQPEEIRTRPQHVENTKKGSSGTVVKLSANYFKLLTVTDWCLYQYHVDFAPEEDRNHVRKSLLADHKKRLGGYIFDGSMVYTSHKITSDDKPLELCSNRSDGQQVIIKLRLVGDLAKGDYQYIQFFNILMRKCLIHLKLQLVGRNYFDPHCKYEMKNHNLELWPGYITSIRQHENDIMLCAEISHKVMRQDTVLQVLEDCMKNFQNHYKEKFKSIIVGCIILTDYNNRTYRVDDVDFNQTPRSTFKRGSDTISYADYYNRAYELRINNLKQPLLVSRTKPRERRAGMGEFLYLIPELCRMTGIDDEMRTNFRVMRDLADHTRVGPDARIQKLLDFSKRLMGESQIRSDLDEWNMKLAENLVEFSGRILPHQTVIQGKISSTDVRYDAGAEADWTRNLRCLSSEYNSTMTSEYDSTMTSKHNSTMTSEIIVLKDTPLIDISEDHVNVKNSDSLQAIVIIPDDDEVEIVNDIQTLTVVDLTVEHSYNKLSAHAIPPTVNKEFCSSPLFYNDDELTIVDEVRSSSVDMHDSGAVTTVSKSDRAGLSEVIVYSSPDDKRRNRGFCSLEYDSHKSASVAKRRLGTGRVKIWGCDIIVDWADPQEEPDEETMSKVKVLYVRNLTNEYTENKLKETFEPFGKIERVKKIKDYAFIHFEERDSAVKAMEGLNGKNIGSAIMEVSLAKPPSDKKKKEDVLRARGRRMMQMMQVRGGVLPSHPGMMANTMQLRGPAVQSSRGGASGPLRGPMGRGDYDDFKDRSLLQTLVDDVCSAANDDTHLNTIKTVLNDKSVLHENGFNLNSEADTIKLQNQLFSVGTASGKTDIESKTKENRSLDFSSPVKISNIIVDSVDRYQLEINPAEIMLHNVVKHAEKKGARFTPELNLTKAEIKGRSVIETARFRKESTCQASATNISVTNGSECSSEKPVDETRENTHEGSPISKFSAENQNNKVVISDNDSSCSRIHCGPIEEDSELCSSSTSTENPFPSTDFSGSSDSCFSDDFVETSCRNVGHSDGKVLLCNGFEKSVRIPRAESSDVNGISEVVNKDYGMQADKSGDSSEKVNKDKFDIRNDENGTGHKIKKSVKNEDEIKPHVLLNGEISVECLDQSDKVVTALNGYSSNVSKENVVRERSGELKEVNCTFVDDVYNKSVSANTEGDIKEINGISSKAVHSLDVETSAVAEESLKSEYYKKDGDSFEYISGDYNDEINLQTMAYAQSPLRLRGGGDNEDEDGAYGPKPEENKLPPINKHVLNQILSRIESNTIKQRKINEIQKKLLLTQEIDLGVLKMMIEEINISQPDPSASYTLLEPTMPNIPVITSDTNVPSAPRESNVRAAPRNVIPGQVNLPAGSGNVPQTTYLRDYTTSQIGVMKEFIKSRCPFNNKNIKRLMQLTSLTEQNIKALHFIMLQLLQREKTRRQHEDPFTLSSLKDTLPEAQNLTEHERVPSRIPVRLPEAQNLTGHERVPSRIPVRSETAVQSTQPVDSTHTTHTHGESGSRETVMSRDSKRPAILSPQSLVTKKPAIQQYNYYCKTCGRGFQLKKNYLKHDCMRPRWK